MCEVFKKLLSLMLLFTISFFSSHFLTSLDDKIDLGSSETTFDYQKKLDNKVVDIKQRIKSSESISNKNIKATVQDSADDIQKSIVAREIASISTSSLISDNRSKNKKVHVTALSNEQINISQKINLLKDHRVNFTDRTQVKKVLIKEIMDISFVNSDQQKEEALEVTDMKEYLESLSPSDNEVYFFELYNQLSKVLEQEELRETSLDLYERVSNQEAKSLVVLHLLENDTQSMNLNFLLDNLSRDQVLSHVPDNYNIELIDNVNVLTVYDGPVYEDDLWTDADTKSETVEDIDSFSTGERSL